MNERDKQYDEEMQGLKLKLLWAAENLIRDADEKTNHVRVDLYLFEALENAVDAVHTCAQNYVREAFGRKEQR